MINHNSITVAGRLTAKPELKSLPSGQQVASLTIATNHIYTPKEGEKKDIPEYHRVVLFGRQAENATKYLDKGSVALVTGRKQTRQYEKDGVRQERCEIIADNIQFGDAPVRPKTGNTDIDYPLPDETNEPSSVPF